MLSTMVWISLHGLALTCLRAKEECVKDLRLPSTASAFHRDDNEGAWLEKRHERQHQLRRLRWVPVGITEYCITESVPCLGLANIFAALFIM